MVPFAIVIMFCIMLLSKCLLIRSITLFHIIRVIVSGCNERIDSYLIISYHVISVLQWAPDRLKCHQCLVCKELLQSTSGSKYILKVYKGGWQVSENAALWLSSVATVSCLIFSSFVFVIKQLLSAHFKQAKGSCGHVELWPQQNPLENHLFPVCTYYYNPVGVRAFGDWDCLKQ